MPIYPSPKQIEAIYTQRDADVARLSESLVIEPADIAALDRLGRCKVANELWAKCSESTRSALRTDEHHFVRSCAALAQ